MRRVEYAISRGDRIKKNIDLGELFNAGPRFEPTPARMEFVVYRFPQAQVFA
jgi:hypothetical protein